ncbi:hypothetical protein TWF106_007946 [Orbilia oligospora]|uniref:BHLH domain-containing protein n=1 Tax=Orbilia oligospora TaxID=2813651 RepID=A0A7C8UTM1_ORBOL|nr:hypothetical protein TWF679_003912 [Orbilia oligospora]KAF3217437.1 hypothetical protein TWF106_007946 [Orbilia oligospora]KAF3222597.1 hypothetical protein TWF191_006678 [Orbilia oligospora]
MSGGNQWEREGTGSTNGDGGGSPMAVERQTLPSISNLTSSVPPVPSPASSGHSPSQSSVKTDTRDSGNWSMTTASNHSSLSSPMNITAMTQDQNQNQNHAAGRGSILNPDSQRDSLNPPLHSSTRPAPNVLTSPYGIDNSPSNSRRSSFDTRLGSLALNSNHGTPAASQVSLVSQLQRERSGGFNQGSPAPSILENGTHSYTPISPNGHYPTPSVSSAGSGPRSSFGSWNNGLAPTSHAQNPERPGARVAPPIIGSSRYPYPHPNAPSPTKGFPYAFPDPDAAGPTAPNSREGLNGQATSSQVGGPGQAASTSTTASSHHGHPSYGQPSYQEIHHHSLQRGPSSIGAPSPATPYSRTPELRISHKLAERKRRKEMKELFDELRDALPQERGGKSSKWEVLTKSIEYLGHMRQSQSSLSQTNHELASENQNLASQNENLNRELERLRSELRQRSSPNDTHYSSHPHPPPSNGNGDAYPTQNSHQSGHTNGLYNGNSHQQHQTYQHQQPRQNTVDGNQMQGIERSNY